MTLARNVLYYCGLAEVAVGVFLMLLMLSSLLLGDWALTSVFRYADVGLLGANSWQQAAVAFGMHAYADIANGLEQMKCVGPDARAKALPKVVSLWNSVRFFISFIAVVVVVSALVAQHGETFSAWPPLSLLFIAVLGLDAVVLRPLAVFFQRAHDDANPPEASEEAGEWERFSPLQRFCRGVFYYEAVLSGTSGIVYLLAPQIFPWLFVFPGAEAASTTVLFSFRVFGAFVAAFGLYQMNADIDTRTGHVIWWLLLDFVWRAFQLPPGVLLPFCAACSLFPPRPPPPPPFPLTLFSSPRALFSQCMSFGRASQSSTQTLTPSCSAAASFSSTLPFMQTPR
jgi:hypothetical protein